MKYYSEFDIYMGDKIYSPKNGIVDLPHELPEQFKRVEETSEHAHVESETIVDEKEELIKMAVELGLGAESTLKRNSVETLRKKIEEA